MIHLMLGEMTWLAWAVAVLAVLACCDAGRWRPIWRPHEGNEKTPPERGR